MADPLRRTLSKLRDKRSKRVAAAGAGGLAVHVASGRSCQEGKEPVEDQRLQAEAIGPEETATAAVWAQSTKSLVHHMKSPLGEDAGVLPGPHTGVCTEEEAMGGCSRNRGLLSEGPGKGGASPGSYKQQQETVGGWAGSEPWNSRVPKADEYHFSSDRVPLSPRLRTPGFSRGMASAQDPQSTRHIPLADPELTPSQTWVQRSKGEVLPASRCSGSYPNGLTFLQHCPVGKWESAKALVSELATVHPDHARHICATLKQTFRESLHSHHSVESEEDDYYDNENLHCNEHKFSAFQLQQLRGSQEPAGIHSVPLGGSTRKSECESNRKGINDSYQDTDRLRTQLQEAYYLLIHAMHDMPIDNEPTNKSSGFVQISPSSCQSQDSVCTQSSVRAIESDVWSTGEASPQQMSDTDSVAVKRLKGTNSLPGMKIHSKSLDILSSRSANASLRRSLSDSLIKYYRLQSQDLSEPELQPSWGFACQPCEGGLDSQQEGSAQAAEQLVSWQHSDCSNVNQSYGNNEVLSDFGSTVNSFQDSADIVIVMCNKADDFSKDQGGLLKPPGVTVKKMQKWMYKGRMLSLEMKERIIGSSQKDNGTYCSLASQAHSGEEDLATTSAASEKVQGGNKALWSGSSDRVLLTDFIENVYASSVIRRELKVSEANEVNEKRLQNNSITVSKKRNWLQQSTQKSPFREENRVCMKNPGEVSWVPKSSCPGLRKLPVPRRLPVGPQNPVGAPHSTKNIHSAPASFAPLGKTCALGEENDADDEGEIWYNPIPEDDEPVHPMSSDSQAITLQKKLSDSDLTKVLGPTGGLPCSSECVGGVQTAPSSEINCADSLHSTESSVQLHKQRFACKTQTGKTVEEKSLYKSFEAGPGGPTANKVELASEFSPPSSPSPLKKGGPINWSFPDKIKSPRTVRKLSMKMKKLPELSRKLNVKGATSHNSSDQPSSLLKGNCQDTTHVPTLPSVGSRSAAASRNVISRYHLDSSVSSQHNCKKKSAGNSKSSSKGGYLSDGDSPELITKSGKHGSESRCMKGKEAFPSNNIKTEIDIDAFRHYSFLDQAKCSQYVSGLMSVHFYGAEDLKPPRMDAKEVFCAIQVDSVNKARTALLTCRTSFLDMDHAFNIELENAQHLKLVVFSWEATPRRNRVCCHGTVVLPTLFRVTRTHRLAVKLEPRGIIYVKLTLMEQWENSHDTLDLHREPVIFGVEARKVVEKENVGLMVPLLLQKCIVEIEKRGCQVVGLYRLCGSAAVKKELREAFERDSKAVSLCESLYPDINVITGVLKDYLRELPSPLITKQLYDAVLNAMIKKPLKMTANGCENDVRAVEFTVGLLDCLPEVEKATLKMLLDHLKLVASYHAVNKMTCQNLAVCFGPVLLSQRQETSSHNKRVFTDSEELASALDFKKHIEVLHYLLQLWPVQNSASKESIHRHVSSELQSSLNYLRRKKQRPQILNLSNAELSGVLRPRQARLDSPSSNRYAGDWSSCGGNYFLHTEESMNEADYDDVPSEDTESGEDCNKVDGPDNSIENSKPIAKDHSFKAYMKMQAIDSTVEHRVNLKDLQESIDTLIGNLERELNKNKLNISY
ncbi:rho GTPase-activating protein SYDE2 [Rhinatrema bivittatum]|uniref:rho GTPase-activating protein SYDE2 n=1 Tax=Rhinatrema bivittatum TaxID=194408 RepID=UPI00112B52CC|nr:rho GTPase-activating protein SYDE2 [Rhinatrema bivittatum]XP_029474673.1 rho GTPase-activating protein SYDE2 [Rhinatrema bivittatum]